MAFAAAYSASKSPSKARTIPKPSNATVSLLQSAFAERPDIAQALLRDIHSIDEATIQELSKYVLTLRQRPPATETEQPPTTQTTSAAQGSKKRKLEEAVVGDAKSWADPSMPASYTAGDVSFSVPQRKKLRLEWIDSSRSDQAAGGIRAVGPAGGVEFGIRWKEIDQIFCVPVPDKPKRQHNFIIIPYQHCTPAIEPLLWTVFEPTPKDGPSAPQEPSHTSTLLTAQLSPFHKSVTFPSPSDFASAIPQPHRKGEPAFHVKAHRGAKDGYLYFLPRGILFAFKKPLLFLPFDVVSSVSYTSVLQRTFNLNIVVSRDGEDEEDEEEEIEFAMLDQADFPGIDGYVKRHGLHDASLAAGRRARKYDVNKVKSEQDKEVKVEDGDEDDGLTELQRAEQMLQDEEDEEEEDYVDEGSEDDEGSGSEDDEDGDEGMGVVGPEESDGNE